MGFDAGAVRALRPARPANDPWRHQGVTVETERGPDGVFISSATVFLTGAECPFTCVFCDLWRHAIDGPTPEGALPAQLRSALGRLRPSADGSKSDLNEQIDPCRKIRQIKLYNASNFFDGRAVPPEDLEPIAQLVAGFERVVVECHPRLVDDSVERFASLLPGRLEVAMGLETVHPEALSRLGKQMTPGQFDRAARRLRDLRVDLRVFVLVGAPFVPAAEQAEWAARSVHHAAAAGARSVALIPVRGGNGELERLERLGRFEPPSLALVERALALALVAAGPGTAVQLDPWDLEQVGSDCAVCREARVESIRMMNRTGRPGRTVCDACSD